MSATKLEVGKEYRACVQTGPSHAHQIRFRVTNDYPLQGKILNAWALRGTTPGSVTKALMSADFDDFSLKMTEGKVTVIELSTHEYAELWIAVTNPKEWDQYEKDSMAEEEAELNEKLFSCPKITVTLTGLRSPVTLDAFHIYGDEEESSVGIANRIREALEGKFHLVEADS